MKFRSLILTFCLTISTGCLGVGYFLAGYWQIVPILFSILLFVTMMKKQPVDWSASSFLLAYIILAAIGVVADFSIELMIIASTFALVSWDLMQFKQSMVGNLISLTNTPLEKWHLRSLAVATAAGLLLAFMSLYIHLQLSFGIIAGLVLITLGGLTYSVQHIRKTKQ